MLPLCKVLRQRQVELRVVEPQGASESFHKCAGEGRGSGRRCRPSVCTVQRPMLGATWARSDSKCLGSYASVYADHVISMRSFSLLEAQETA